MQHSNFAIHTLNIACYWYIYMLWMKCTRCSVDRPVVVPRDENCVWTHHQYIMLAMHYIEILFSSTRGRRMSFCVVRVFYKNSADRQALNAIKNLQNNGNKTEYYWPSLTHTYPLHIQCMNSIMIPAAVFASRCTYKWWSKLHLFQRNIRHANWSFDWIYFTT